MKFRYAILFVEDVLEAIAFFEAAFGGTRGFVHEGGDYGEMLTGETKLAFSSLALMAQLGKSARRHDAEQPSYEIAFECEDVTGAVARAVAAGARLVQAARVEPWGQTTGYVATPQGILVELCTAIAAPA
ncbi:MAG TPA: glyoxalase [Rhodobacteraceae bacterium]|mgnify:FL=1|jgi:lactoylglutathione lyase|nr:glyoxalase [Paracoccaceae bacterium]HBV54092.1 glyoxalase [Paracoccaceae bacterium]